MSKRDGHEIARQLKRDHADAIEHNRAIFLEWPPDDFAPYAYTYYDGNGNPLYHGYTTNARRRAGEHFKRAPWASWVEDVRYRRCKTAHAARRLESRLQRKVPALFLWAWHDQLPPGFAEIDAEFPVNHVTGTCRRPGGSCHPATVLARMTAIIDAENAS